MKASNKTRSNENEIDNVSKETVMVFTGKTAMHVIDKRKDAGLAFIVQAKRSRNPVIMVPNEHSWDFRTLSHMILFTMLFKLQRAQLSTSTLDLLHAPLLVK